jgi:hypothetical protein
MIDDLLVNIHYNYYCITKRDKCIYIYIYHDLKNLTSSGKQFILEYNL